MNPFPSLRFSSIRHVFGLAATAGSLWIGSATQAAVITFTDTLPTTNVIASNAADSSANNRQFYNMNASTTPINRWAGVGFQATANASIDRMTFYIYNDTVGTSVPGATMTISIVSLPSLTATPDAPFSPLYSETATVPSVYANENYITFDLTTPYSLTANNYYGIVLSFNDASSGTTRYLNLKTSPTNTGGTNGLGRTFWTNDAGASWSSDSQTANFVLQTVPEPSSIALALVATITLGGCARRKMNA